MQKLKQDGTPDKRYKSSSSGPVLQPNITRSVPATWDYKFANGISIQFKGPKICQLNFGIQGSMISCGVREMNNVSSISGAISQGVPRDIVVKAMREFIVHIKQINRAAYIIASNNNRSEVSNGVMDEITTIKTDWKRNPNSSNLIRCWVM